jgi:hypothetical protein
MLRIAWWAAVTLLIVESCANKPVASLEAAGSFVITLPKSLVNSEYHSIIPGYWNTPRGVDTVLYLFGADADSVWMYRYPHPEPVRQVCLSNPTWAEITSTYFDLEAQCLYAYDHNIRRLYRLDSDLRIVRIDTLTPLFDAEGMRYSVSSEVCVSRDVVTCNVGAHTDVATFLNKPCLAQFDLKGRVWRFVHSYPKEIREDPERSFWNPVLSDVVSHENIVHFRYAFSDSIYVLRQDGSVVPVTKSIDPNVNFHAKLPDPPPSSFSLWLTEPYIVYYNYIRPTQTHVSVLSKGQPLRSRDGRMASDENSRYSLIVTKAEETSVVDLPEDNKGLSPCPLVLGDKMAFVRRSRRDGQEGRMTFAMYRIAMK